ncbi:MAG: UDP-N-acetylmuramate dehydrogenase [Actinomycetota bacterium]
MPVVPGDPVGAALRVLGERGQREVPLGPLTTYRVGGAAAVYVDASSLDDLRGVARAHAESGLPLLIIGRGSNLLIADEGFNGIAVAIGAAHDSIDIDEASNRVTAGAGTLLPVLARRTAAAGWRGLEWAVGVPGSVGGAVRMNAGGHGSDVAHSLLTVTVADLDRSADDIVLERPAAELGLRFRGSGLSASSVVLDATFQLRSGDRDAAESEIAEIVAWRRANQPGGQNAGSVFVNPIPGELSAGELIDRAGLRGWRHGSASVSEKHANFIQADADGTAADVRELMRIVRNRVEEQSGVRLRSEIRLIGFDQTRADGDHDAHNGDHHDNHDDNHVEVH